MSAFIALARPGMTAAEVAKWGRRLEAQGWRLAVECDGLLVALRGAWSLPVRPLPGGRGVLIGEIFDRRATDDGQVASFDTGRLAAKTSQRAAHALSVAGWGRYVALLLDDQQTLSVFRDPSGSLDCVTWRRSDMVFVSNAAPDEGLGPIDLAIDWAAVATILGAASRSALTCALRGVSTIAPGVVWHGEGRGHQSVWTPAQSARSPQRRAPEQLAQRLDAVIAALKAPYRRILAEASGGLDSTIVASTLSRQGAAIARLVNQSSAWAESDERLYARDLARSIEAPLAEVERPIFRLQVSDLLRCSDGLRPRLGLQDAPYDQAMAHLIDQLEADAVFTGHGGDAVFFQMRAPAVAADLVWEAAPLRERLSALVLWSQRSRQTVWRTLVQGLFEGAASMALPPPPFLSASAAPAALHPWLKDAASLSCAKRFQIFTLINTHNLVGESLMGRRVDVIHPLLSQPIVEFCLQMPVTDLAVGDRDRPFARRAFADRLPPRSLLRRGKGDTSGLYARSIAESLEVLAPFLLEGRLVQRGLIDREALTRHLDADAMMWRPAAGPILHAAYTEAWVRSWEAKLR